MLITYAFAPRPQGTTLARIRVRGDIAGYPPRVVRLAAPPVARRVLVSIRSDPRDLERVLTAPTACRAPMTAAAGKLRDTYIDHHFPHTSRTPHTPA